MEFIMKKLFTGLLCLAMAASLFAGCGGGGASSTADSAASTTESEAGSQSQTGAAEPSGGGHSLKILGPHNTNPYIKFSEREDYPVWQEFMKLFEARGVEVDFEVVANDQYLTVIQTRLASATDLPDFCQFTGLDDSTALNLVAQGMLLPVNQIIDAHSDGTAKSFFDTGKGQYSRRLNTTEDGNMYWISQIQATTYDNKPGSTSMGISIRKDWLDTLGMDVPATSEEFRQMLVAFRENDLNGNGVADEVLAFDPANWSNGIAQWYGLVGELSSFIIEGSEVTSPWYQPGAKDYFAFLNALASENLLDTTLIGNQTADQLDQRIAENKAGAIFTYVMQTWYEPSTGAPDALYLPIGPLKGTDAAEPVNAIEPPFLSYHRWGFTKACQDLEAAAALLDILCGEEYETLCQWGIEGDTYEVVDGQKKLLDIALNANWEQAGAEKKSIGDSLWANGAMLPKRRFVPMENEISVVPAEKAQYQRDVIDYHPTVPLGNSNYFPIMTKEQVERRLELFTDLDTRSKELATQLILGQAPLDNWDAYIAELDSLGLSEIVAIDQTLLDRYNSFE